MPPDSICSWRWCVWKLHCQTVMQTEYNNLVKRQEPKAEYHHGRLPGLDPVQTVCFTRSTRDISRIPAHHYLIRLLPSQLVWAWAMFGSRNWIWNCVGFPHVFLDLRVPPTPQVDRLLKLSCGGNLDVQNTFRWTGVHFRVYSCLIANVPVIWDH